MKGSGLVRPDPSLCWRYLSSRAVASQVFSAQVSLTAVFGMGTGGPSPQSTPTHFSLKRKVSKRNFHFLLLTVLFNDKALYSLFFSLSRETLSKLSSLSSSFKRKKVVTRAGIEPTFAA